MADLEAQAPAPPAPAGGGGAALLASLPPVSRALAGLVLVLWLFGLLWPSAGNTFLALHPGYVGPPNFYIWTLLTSGFFENTVLNGLLNMGGVLFFGRYLEPLWGAREYVRFVLLVSALSGVAVFFSVTLLFLATQQEALLRTPFCSFSGVIVGLAVALKQLIPDTELKVALVVPLRARHFPLLIVAATVAAPLLGLPAYPVPHTLFGLLWAWLYLRYFQRKGENVGDRSEGFAFATLFPDPLQPPVALLAGLLHRLCMPVLGACCGLGAPAPLPRSDSDTRLGTGSPPPPAADPDSERRRQRALAALDQRMAELKGGAAPAAAK